MGCRYCMLACPFGIPRYDWEAAVPYVRKCTFCYPRIKAGKKPACAEACEEGAVLFGDRETLIATHEEAGFVDVQCISLTMGVVTITHSTKPE